MRGLFAAPGLLWRHVLGYGAVPRPDDRSGGSAVANVKVTLTNESTNPPRSTVASADGRSPFASVIPAVYTVSLEAPSFRNLERQGAAVATPQFITVDQNRFGQVTESVLVTEEVPLIETSNASQGQVIDRQKRIDRPTLGRNPSMCSRLAPNVQQVGNPADAPMRDQAGSSPISIAGGNRSVFRPRLKAIATPRPTPALPRCPRRPNAAETSRHRWLAIPTAASARSSIPPHRRPAERAKLSPATSFPRIVCTWWGAPWRRPSPRRSMRRASTATRTACRTPPR